MSRPRTDGPRDSLLYFRGIASRSSEEFERAARTRTQNDYFRDLSKQCHRNAEIADVKFEWLRRAMLLLFLGLVPWLAAVFALFQVR